MTNWGEMLADRGSVAPIGALDGQPIDTIDGVRCTIGDTACALVWCDFDVAAGTLSRASADRFVDVVTAATDAGLPLIGIANSGGVRMQEGPRAFVRMIDLVAAVRRHRTAGLALIAYLCDPTTGGILASWGTLAQVTAAEPGALIGFTGPRVAAGLGAPIDPPDVQHAEGLLARGQLDAVVPPAELGVWLAEVLAVLGSSAGADLAPPANREQKPAPGAGFHSQNAGGGEQGWGEGRDAAPTGWAAVQASRRDNRPVILDRVIGAADDGRVVEVCGDRSGQRDRAVWCGFMRLGHRRVLVIGHRTSGHRPARPTAAGLRTARRAMGIADELGIAVLTVIDTPGATIDAQQEAEGYAGEVARSIDAMASLRVPTVAVLAGQGGGGPALAWFAARTRIGVPDAWLAPISPEAGSLIVHRDDHHAAEIAGLQEVSSIELARDGVLDAVVSPVDVVGAVLDALRVSDEVPVVPTR